MNASTVLVLGANGRFGQAAVQAFADAGWRVLAQARRTPTHALPPSARHIDAPLCSTDALAEQAAGASVVVHAINPIYAQWDTEAIPLARAGMDLATRLSAAFMLPGNVYNYGERMPAQLMEDTPQNPTTSKGRLRLEIENEMQARASRGMRSVVIRAGDFYGCGRGSWLDQLIIKDIAKGKLVYPGPLDVPHAWGYLPDLARAFVAVASTRYEPAFRNLHFAGHTLTGRALLQAIESAAIGLGRAPTAGFRHGGMPWNLIRAVGVVHPMWRELARMSYLWRVPHALDGSALARIVGALPSTPVLPALRQALIDLGLGPMAAPADIGAA